MAANPDVAQALHGALAAHAGPDRPVAVDELGHADSRRFVWLVSRSDGELAVKPMLATGLALRTLAGELVLPPFGVGVYELIGP